MLRRALFLTDLGLLLACAAPAAGQSRIVGTVYDSLGAGGPLAGATVVLVERSRYATTDVHGRFRFDTVAAGRYRLSLLHTVLDSFDLAMPAVAVTVGQDSIVSVELATPSAQTAFDAGCALRLASASSQSDVVAYLKVRAACAGLLRRAEVRAFDTREASDPATGARSRAQPLSTVVVSEKARSMSPMAIYGYEDRRRMGLGTFLTPEFLAKNPFSSLVELLHSSPAVKVEYGTGGRPVVYVRGTSGTYCAPTFFVDNMEFDPRHYPRMVGQRDAAFVALGMAFSELNAMAPSHLVKGVEIYDSPGETPAQYDRSATTGCGSIVIWTR
ncbi:MAG: carboxypeptidase regulatory-like domain-containing protein [Gemmatimonadetes bacterium]|nr:carboxypeptidase regulatory-like domain-containing protein [Gemmatimonadota bacterium]